MEEILASIRRILNDDEAPAESADAGGTADTPADDDVLVLDESMLVAEPAPPVADAPAADASAAEPPATDHAAAEQEAFHATVVPPEAERPQPAPELAPDRAIEAMTPASPVDPRGDPTTDPREQPAPAFNLLAPETAAAAASSVGSLVRTLAAGRATQVYTGGPTLEDMVRAELRPLLKEWLDLNLPPMVERLVRAEIERVVGREVP